MHRFNDDEDAGVRSESFNKIINRKIQNIRIGQKLQADQKKK
jgi:hypothetical protein